MALTDTFIRRPVFATCVNLLILIAGLAAVGRVSVRQYPRSDLAAVIITTAYVGADAELVRGFITTPLERVIASADGIDYLESASIQGLSTITARLRLNFNVNDALTQIQAKVAQVRNELPPEAEAPVINVENAETRFASMYIGFSSSIMERNQITDYLTRVVQPKLSSIAGVERADILGARTFAMRIWLKPDQMAALNISAREVRNVLEANNYLSAVGSTKGSTITVSLATNTDLQSQHEFEQLVVRQDEKTVVRLRDIADVVLGAENYDEDVRFSGEVATFMGVWTLPNANALDVIANVRTELEHLEKVLPTGLNVGIPYDATEYIRDAIREVTKTLSETILIVIGVIFLFIGSFRSVLIPVVAIPLSLLGGVALMAIFGFTLNLLTLLAIVLSVGLVVDDAIVMLENIERHVQEGLSPREAAFKGARELVGPVIAMTITLAAVYVPIGIQGGLTGALFREFAFTLAGAVAISGIVALTLSPMMASKLVSHTHHPSRFKLLIDNGFERIRNGYEQVLRASLTYRHAIVVAAILVMLCIFPFYGFSTKELAPREDQGIVFGIVQASPNNSLDQTLIYASAIEQVFRNVPEYRRTFQITMPTGGFSGVLLTPWSERERTAQDIEGELWGTLGVIPGVRVIVATPPALPGGSDFPIELVISSTADPEHLVGYAGQLVERAFASGKFMFADSDLHFDLPRSEIIIDRDHVAMLGLNLSEVGADLATMLGGNYVNRFSIAGRSYKVIPQVKRMERMTPDQLLDFYVSSPGGEAVPISTFTTLKDTVEPRQLNRFQQLNSAKIQGALIPGVSIDEGLNVLEEAAAEILPRDYVVDYAGESRQLRKEATGMTGILLLAIVVIFLVLASQFESFRDPLIILLGSVPLALAGALCFVFLDFTTLNIYSQVGLVTLVGLVSKNGILIVEFANKLREEGLEKIEAVTQAATTRLRPVLMTTVATVVGHFPLVLASGPGAGARNSIGTVLVSGMIIGTLFTLFVVPSIYTFVASARRHEDDHPPEAKLKVDTVDGNGRVRSYA